MSAFSRLCRFVDWDLSKGPRVSAGNVSLAIGLLLGLPFIAFRSSAAGRLEPLILGVTLAVAVAWSALVAWRAWRLIRASAAKGDRQYDREGKLTLSAEYQDSQSATKTRSRK